MKISHKVFLYSALMTLLVASMILLYFIFMIPGLYADNQLNQNRQLVAKIQDQSVSTNDCSQFKVMTNMVSITVILPESGSTVYTCNSYSKLTIDVKQKELLHLIDVIRQQNTDSDDYKQWIDDVKGKIDLEALKTSLLDSDLAQSFQLSDFVLNPALAEDPYNDTSAASYTTTPLGYPLIESTVVVEKVTYASYVSYAQLDNRIVITMGSSMTSPLNELLPIILQSLPMIIAAILVLTTLIALFFSRQLAQPVVQLAQKATLLPSQPSIRDKPSSYKGEFKTLEDALNDLYRNLNEALLQQQDQNRQLEQAKHHQELFLMNSSHTLKTPVTSALLLVDSMIQQVGKYKDTTRYLPEVRRELLGMQAIIYEMLDLLKLKNEAITLSPVHIGTLINCALTHQQILLDQRQLTVQLSDDGGMIQSDEHLLSGIIDNLIMNAVTYAQENTTIAITITPEQFTIENQCEPLSEAVLDHIFEPFFKENSHGHGLGLFLAQSYAQRLNFELTLKNTDHSVLATCALKEKEHDYH